MAAIKNNSLSILIYTFFIGLLSSILINCKSNGDEELIVEADTTKPTISCISNINETVDVFTTGMVVNYTEPMGTDNLSGVTTTQIEGLASGEMFPIGTTTNTFEARDTTGNTAKCSFNVIITKDVASEAMPFFIDTNPTPDGKTWHKIEGLSDEFDNNDLDETKWLNTDPSRWVGRAPGIFKKNTVSVIDGNLKLTTYKLDASEVVNGRTYTHAGSYIGSKIPAQVGYYFECKMKANKTFMSSTFWLINHRNEGSGCDRRVAELDIQECVGEITTTANWAQNFDESMHSNTHSRQADCSETPIGSTGNNTEIIAKVFDDYHVYAAWWKSATEIEFYLDGKKVYTVNPKANFDLPMYMRMVVETYDWNPVPSDGGMTGTAEERTTSYNWVRTWELKDQ